MLLHLVLLQWILKEALFSVLLVLILFSSTNMHCHLMRSDFVLGAEHPEMSGEELLTLGSSQHSGGHKQRDISTALWCKEARERCGAQVRSL